MMVSFTIHANNFLKVNVKGWYNLPYIGYRKNGNPDFLNVIKNNFNDVQLISMKKSRQMVENILSHDLKELVQRWSLRNCLCVCVPRSKSLTTYTPHQLFFRDAVRNVASTIQDLQDGTHVIRRHTNTFTSHLSSDTGRVTATGKKYTNDGNKPYPGITKDTCSIDKEMVYNHRVLLVDDIYTKCVNVDEDCLQALLDNGAKEIFFYAIACTEGRL